MSTGSIIYFLFILAWFFVPALAVIPWWVVFAPVLAVVIWLVLWVGVLLRWWR